MSTTLAKNETVQRKWYVIDAAGKPMGRTAATVASLLRGKHKVDFTPNVDCGDFVIIINADQAVLTGKQAGSEEVSAPHRLDRRTSRRPSISTLMNERPEFAMELAVKGMLPKNSIGRNAARRLKVYQGAEHHPCRPEARSLDAGLRR